MMRLELTHDEQTCTVDLRTPTQLEVMRATLASGRDPHPPQAEPVDVVAWAEWQIREYERSLAFLRTLGALPEWVEHVPPLDVITAAGEVVRACSVGGDALGKSSARLG
jgi:hypothetical protein